MKILINQKKKKEKAYIHYYFRYLGFDRERKTNFCGERSETQKIILNFGGF